MKSLVAIFRLLWIVAPPGSQGPGWVGLGLTGTPRYPNNDDPTCKCQKTASGDSELGGGSAFRRPANWRTPQCLEVQRHALNQSCGVQVYKPHLAITGFPSFEAYM